MQHILITGGAGYIGSHIIKSISSYKDSKITIIDDLSSSTFDSLPVLRRYFNKNQLKFFKINLNKLEKLEDIFKQSKFDAIIHLAASSQVNESIALPLKYFLNNTVNTTHLINLCLKYKVNKFIFSSTAAVYGAPSSSPIKESCSTKPINPYGISKKMCETMLMQASQAYKNFHCIILRYFNVAGADPEGELGECHEPETHLIPLLIRSAQNKNYTFKLYGDDHDTFDGTCIRDYIHVQDLASAHIQALNFLQEHNCSEIFNCGYGTGYSVRQIIDTIKKLTATDFNIKIRPKRPGEPSTLVADNKKIINTLKWKYNFNAIEQICQSSIDWELKKNT